MTRLAYLWRGSVVWPNARAWRAREPQGSVGSNPTLSADFFCLGIHNNLKKGISERVTTERNDDNIHPNNSRNNL